MRNPCYFLAIVHHATEDTIFFDLYHITKPLYGDQTRGLVKSSVSLPNRYFDFLIHSGVLEMQGLESYQPTQVHAVAIGMNIKSLGTNVLFDMCFSPQTYKLWQNSDAAIEEINLPADIFEEYVYRLGALSRFRYLGKIDDPLTATQLGENDMIEFKRDFLNSKSAIIKAVVAFANSNNGNLYLGINDDNTIVGINEELAHYGDQDKYMLAITQYIQDKTTPLLAPFPKISIKKVDDKYVACIFVEVGSELICGLDKNNEKFVSIRTNNRSIIVRDPHQIGEIYVKRKLGTEVSRRLGLL
ncbi:ATP-binding protein [Brevibacillus fluminis]|uniref:ATP-binding protein n=1 Tax=Brevibacillus fluminis TaxID=511487 RepID=A0A3M8DVE5_9BACL|nr:ATP-binding protein [Brevibacillus fluminis]RNB91894.1 ATP-binding protein [Brevibacillus fluminis]